MNSVTDSYSVVRKRLYDDVYETELANFGIDLRVWKKHPYTKLKSYYYLELGALFTYLLLKTNIKPNTITLFYAFQGLVAVLLIMTGNKMLITMALFIFFTKAVPDWIDGHIARIKGMTSKLGHYLDTWGAHVNVLSFQVGIAVYVGVITGITTYFYLACLIAMSSAINFRSFIYQYVNNSIPSLSQNNYHSGKAREKDSLYSLIQILKNIFVVLRYNGRSRYTDLVILIILIELFFDAIYLSGFIVWGWAVINVLYFFYSLQNLFSNADEILK